VPLGTTSPRRSDLENLLLKASISKRFLNKRVLDNVSLEARRGEKIAIVGPNGAGKTTLLKSISSLINIDEGFINNKASKTIYVPELDFVPRLISVKEWFTLHMCDENALAKRLGIDAVNEAKSLWDKRVSMLSKGQRRLVGILGVLCSFGNQEHHLILIDEPFTGLASHYRKVVGEAIRLSRSTIIASFHDIEEALGLADKIYYLEEGRLQPLSKARLGGGTAKLRVVSWRNEVVYERDIKSLGELFSLLHSFAKSREVKKLCIEFMREEESS